MNLVIDAGNSSIKYAVFKGGEITISGRMPYLNHAQELQKLVTNDIKIIAYSTVKNNPIDNFLIRNQGLQQVKIDATSKFPFINLYQTPQTLGADRLAACAGAFALQKKGGFVVVDIGTCITYDFVNTNNEYLGGAISPGIHMRFKAMNSYTDQLPLINHPEISPKLIGDSTLSSLHSGVINGIMFEISGFLKELSANQSKINIYLTGGDAVFFENALKSSIFAEPLLNLKGINELIKINA